MKFRENFNILGIAAILAIILSFLINLDSEGRIAVGLFAALSLIFVFFVTYRSCGNIPLPTPTSVFVVLSSIQGLFGCFLAYLEGRSGSELAVLTIAGALISLSIGILLANADQRFRPQLEVHNYLRCKVVGTEDSGNISKRVLLFGVFSIVLSLIYYNGIPLIWDSLKLLFAGEHIRDVSSIISMTRRSLTKGHLFLGMVYRGQGILRLFWLIVLPYLTFCSIFYYRITKKRSWQRISLFLVPFLVIFIAGSGERSRSVWILVIYIFANFYIQGRLTKANVIRWCIIGISSYFLLTILIGRTGIEINIGTLFENLGKRLLRSESSNTVDAFYLIPKYQPYYYGQIILSYLENLVPGPSSRRSFSYILAQLQGGRSGESLTYASSTFFATTYGDFGVLGTIVLSFCSGFLLQLVTIKLCRRQKTVSSLVLFAFLSGYMGYSLFTGTLLSPIASTVMSLGVYYFLRNVSNRS